MISLFGDKVRGTHHRRLTVIRFYNQPPHIATFPSRMVDERLHVPKRLHPAPTSVKWAQPVPPI
jgi:hypothetical protein